MSEQKVRCAANEHFYDAGENSSCPFCRGTVVQGQPGAPGDADAKSNSPADPTPAPAPDVAGDGRETVLEWARRRPPGDAVADGDVDTDKEQAPAEPPAREFDRPPVVGWLIVATGLGAGRDLRLYPGTNWIGRDPSMDIALAFGDAGISARDHAALIYDVECNGYFVKHERGRNLTYLNEKRVTGETRLKAYDRIRIHDTEMLFLPLCGKRFQWG